MWYRQPTLEEAAQKLDGGDFPGKIKSVVAEAIGREWEETEWEEISGYGSGNGPIRINWESCTLSPYGLLILLVLVQWIWNYGFFTFGEFRCGLGPLKFEISVRTK